MIYTYFEIIYFNWKGHFKRPTFEDVNDDYLTPKRPHPQYPNLRMLTMKNMEKGKINSHIEYK